MYLDRLFKLMAEKQASDLFISCGAPINIKINGVVSPISTQPMDVETVRRIAYELMSKEQAREFENELEMNLSYLDRAVGNFRINIFRQRGTISLVIRYVRSRVPPFEALKLPSVLLNLVMEKRGLVLIAGATGSGKSTTLAAMIDYRNSNRSGHILTLEDPIEYLFEHKQSIVNQREIGIDTQGYHRALPNALREAPDLIMIGEVRDRETMQHALLHTLTGHLCLSTLHANNSYHALSRIINMFPYDARSGLLSDLSIGLRAIISQRLVRNKEGEQQPAVEILLNTSLIADLIKNGEITQMKEAMEQSLYPGSQTFEQALCRLYLDEVITYDEALSAADSPTNLAWLVNQNTASTTRVDTGRDDEPAEDALSRDFVKLEIDPEFLNRPKRHSTPKRGDELVQRADAGSGARVDRAPFADT
jgi:twitching motility protein PilU